MRHWLKGISNFYLNIWSQFCGPLTLCPLTNSPNQSLCQDAVSHLDRCDITCLLPEMILPSSRSPDVVPSLHKSYPVHNTRPYFIVIFFNFSYLLYGIKYLFYLLLSNYLFITQIQQYLLMPKCKSILVSCKETQSHFLCSKSHHLCVRWFLFSVRHKFLSWPNPSPSLFWHKFLGNWPARKLSFLRNISYINCYFTVSSWLYNDLYNSTVTYIQISYKLLLSGTDSLRLTFI